MEKIKGAFITNCILMAICALLMIYTIVFFRATYAALHSGDASVLAVFVLMPLSFIASLATGVMGAIQVSIAARNLAKVRAWYTILMLVLSTVVVIVPVVLVLLLFIL